ncbi:unknown protein [Oryza sativa Japonica Group]|uniref:Uncharacterized protein n=2 Tax=Oryza sativa subsp. japonica TaxID=39947 RepID=A0A9K3Y839_ORYSJ|nr:hypothetical protein EE612_006685 [Oryza sativa]BAD73398.1 unknown protein [Oryza sativa Japonica Group]BAS75108.1 Os01g0836400 [Oryza sativa Japonica Group]
MKQRRGRHAEAGGGGIGGGGARRRGSSTSAGEGAVASPPLRASSSRRRRMGWRTRHGSGSDSAPLLFLSGELFHSLTVFLSQNLLRFSEPKLAMRTW